MMHNSSIKNQKSKIKNGAIARHTHLLVFLCLLAGGCASRLPHYTWHNDTAALADLAQRGKQVQTLSGQAAVTLTRPSGDRVSFDSAVVAELPQRFRIRAWKFGHAIFDLTVTPDGVWLQRSQRVPSEHVWPTQLTPARFADGWRMISGELPGALSVESKGELMQLRQPLESGLILTTLVHRDTLTVRQYQVHDQQGQARFGLQLSRYRLFDGVAWPTRLMATADQGAIAVRFDQLELNCPLAPAAFTPPRRAEKIQ